MKLHRLSIKLFLERPGPQDPRDLIPIFHSWIQQQTMEDHLLVDVHDYSHLHMGPGIFLYGHEGSFSLDLGDNRMGLLYQRNRVDEGSSNDQLLAVAFRSLLKGCSMLESQRLSGDLVKFVPNEFRLAVHDRLAFPNTEETFHRFRHILSSFLKRMLNGAEFALDHRSDPKQLFAVNVQTESTRGTRELLGYLDRGSIN